MDDYIQVGLQTFVQLLWALKVHDPSIHCTQFLHFVLLPQETFGSSHMTSNAPLSHLPGRDARNVFHR
jgi:hypothetical protein